MAQTRVVSQQCDTNMLMQVTSASAATHIGSLCMDVTVLMSEVIGVITGAEASDS